MNNKSVFFAPIFNKKRPRQALVTDPNNGQTSSTLSSDFQSVSSTYLPPPKKPFQHNQHQGNTTTGECSALKETNYPKSQFIPTRPLTQSSLGKRTFDGGRQGKALNTAWCENSFEKTKQQCTTSHLPHQQNVTKKLIAPLPHQKPSIKSQDSSQWKSNTAYSKSAHNQMVGGSRNQSVEQPSTSSWARTQSVHGRGVQATTSSTGQTPRVVMEMNSSRKEKVEVDKSLRMVTASVSRMKQWGTMKHEVPIMFEVFGSIDSAVLRNNIHNAKEFILKNEGNSVKCIFFEMDRQLPKLTRGQVVRCVGKFCNGCFQCVSIRPATDQEIRTSKSQMYAVEKAMNALVNRLREN